LCLADAVIAYRQEYLIEHCFGRLKGQPLSLRPMFLQREDYIKGLIRLLSIGLRLLTLVEFQVKRALSIFTPVFHRNLTTLPKNERTIRLDYLFKEFDVPFVALAQVNRGVESQSNKQASWDG
jgi:transposase